MSLKRSRESLEGDDPEDGGHTYDGALEDGEAALHAKYDIGDLLGEGSYATVRLATRKSDQSRFAVKLIERDTTSAAEALHERKVLGTLGLNRNIVSLIDHFELSEATALVLELAEGGEVFESICENGAYSEASAAAVIQQVALALAVMHARTCVCVCMYARVHVCMCMCVGVHAYVHVCVYVCVHARMHAAGRPRLGVHALRGRRAPRPQA